MKLMAYDTETSDMVDWKQPSEGPKQPHICELAAIIYHDDGTELDRFHSFVRPDSWTIAEDAQKVHGYTVEYLMDVGRDEVDVVRDFLDFQNDADLRFGFNESFDARIMRIALKRFAPWGLDDPESAQAERDAIADTYRDCPSMCAMRLATPICAIPATEAMKAKGMRFKFKNPTLSEAHLHFLGTPLEGAHGAVADTEGTARVFFHMLKNGLITLPVP